MTRYIDWSAGAPVQHIGLNKYRYETERIGGEYTCEHSAEHLDLTRFKIYQGNGIGNGVERVELDGYQQTIAIGEDIWISDVFMLEEENINTAPWTVIGQLKSLGGPPAVNFELRPEHGGHEIRLISRTSTDPGTPPPYVQRWSKIDLVYGQRYNRVLHVKIDPTGSTGVIEMWWDGVKVVDAQGINTGFSFVPNYYWKFGIYRQDNGVGTPLAAQFANVEVGKGTLLLRVEKPLPVVQILPIIG